MSESEYIILKDLPTPQVYHDLRKLAGMTPPSMDAVPKALANSFACFVAYERQHMVDDTTPSPDQVVVAMGRLSGDGSLFLMLTDLAVHPSHQRRGLGKRIMKSLTDYVDKYAPDAYVSLVAEESAQKLYPLYGFKNVQPSIGMFRMTKGRRAQDEPAEEELEKT